MGKDGAATRIRISFRLHPKDKQKLIGLLPGNLLAFGFSQLVTRVLNNEFSLENLAQYPTARHQKKGQRVLVQPVVGLPMKLAFENYCSEEGYTSTAIATGLACMIVDKKINLEINMERC